MYRYQPALHRLAAVAEGDRRTTLAEAAWGQRGVRYGHMEAGHAAQNALLQAVAFDLDVALVGAFTDAEVQAALTLTCVNEGAAVRARMDRI